jgi:hypothetical protein
VISNFIVANLIPIILAALAAFFGGKVYLKGRKDANEKSDRELQRAYARLSGVTRDADRAGDSIDATDLRSDDGHKRDK